MELAETEFLRFTFILIYLGWYNPYPNSNICPNKQIFKTKFGSVLKQTAVSAGLLIGEYSSSNIVDFISVSLGTKAFAQHITLGNISLINFAFSSGFLSTNAILIGNNAGKNSSLNVKKIIKISSITSILTFIPILILICIFPLEIVRFFAESEDVWKSDDMTQLVYISCISNFFNFQQANVQGFLRGLGIINLTFAVTFICYCLGLPCFCYLFAFYLNWKLKGIWFSMLCINFIVLIFNLIILWSIDIEKICKDFKDEDDDDCVKDKDCLIQNN